MRNSVIWALRQIISLIKGGEYVLQQAWKRCEMLKKFWYENRKVRDNLEVRGIAGWIILYNVCALMDAN
jgi:hypothetical protein